MCKIYELTNLNMEDICTRTTIYWCTQLICDPNKIRNVVDLWVYKSSWGSVKCNPVAPLSPANWIHSVCHINIHISTYYVNADVQLKVNPYEIIKAVRDDNSISRQFSRKSTLQSFRIVIIIISWCTILSLVHQIALLHSSLYASEDSEITK